MSGYIMQIDFFNNSVRCETEGMLVSLNDITNAGNAHRLSNGVPAYQLGTFLTSKTLEEYLIAASKSWKMPRDSFLTKKGRGKTSRTMAHVSVAILLAEQISPEFHVEMHKTFIEGKLLEFREYGGTEFKALNATIDAHLPGRDEKASNKGIFIQVAKQLRAKVLGDGAKAGDWDSATINQTHLRFDYERALSTSLSLGLIKDYNHLKEVIAKL